MLLVLDRETGEHTHKRFYEIVNDLRSGDLLVMNDTKVFRARLKTDDGLEVFLLRAVGGRYGFRYRCTDCTDNTDGRGLRGRCGCTNCTNIRITPQMEGKNKSVWEVLVRPGRRVRVGDRLVVSSQKSNVDNNRRSSKIINKLEVEVLEVEVLEKLEDGTVLIAFDCGDDDVVAFANVHGEIPLPPYVHENVDHIDQYQTVYARETGSVAAPTAGFHFTRELIDRLRDKGVEFAYVTLHVGLGTFRPMKSDTIEEHQMHSEFVSIDEQAAGQINRAKRQGRRVIAVGTTTVRTLEGVAQVRPILAQPSEGGVLRAYIGDVNLFIKPGFHFKVIDGLITNFHLPKSTLLVLVSAFAGRESVLAAYQEAIDHGYRFYSFGDAMFVR
jgi:S-adenosylmethionine:tRNA ribosyltransferase-isomerase